MVRNYTRKTTIPNVTPEEVMLASFLRYNEGLSIRAVANRLYGPHGPIQGVKNPRGRAERILTLKRYSHFRLPRPTVHHPLKGLQREVSTVLDLFRRGLSIRQVAQKMYPHDSEDEAVFRVGKLLYDKKYESLRSAHPPPSRKTNAARNEKLVAEAIRLQRKGLSVDQIAQSIYPTGLTDTRKSAERKVYKFLHEPEFERFRRKLRL